MTTTYPRFNLPRVMRQAVVACFLIVLIAGYSASHPASFQTTTSATTPAAAGTPQTGLVTTP